LLGVGGVWDGGQENNWFESPATAAGALITGVALIALVVWELHTPEPVFNVRVLRNIPLSAASSIGLLFGVAFYGTTFLLPQFTQRLLGYPAYQAGLVLLPRAITLFLGMPIVGWLYNHVDPRLMIAAGDWIDLLHIPAAGPSLDAGGVLESRADLAADGVGHALYVCVAEHARLQHRQAGGDDGCDRPLYVDPADGGQHRLCLGGHLSGS